MSHFKPTIDFRQDASECEMFHPFGKACQDNHDDAASLRSGFGLASTSSLASHRFRTSLTFTPIVGRLDFGMQDKYEQLFGMVNPFVLETNELRAVRG